MSIDRRGGEFVEEETSQLLHLLQVAMIAREIGGIDDHIHYKIASIHRQKKILFLFLFFFLGYEHVHI